MPFFEGGGEGVQYIMMKLMSLIVPKETIRLWKK